MTQEPDKQDQAALQHEAEHAKPRKKVSVLGYLTILFAAAFLLLTMSYLQQQRNNEELQRSNEEVISGLKESASAVQSIENLITERDALNDQVAELSGALETTQAALERTEQENQTLKAQTEQQQNQAKAMDYLRKIQELYAIQYYRTAREVITELKAQGLDTCLPTTSYVQGESSPAEGYQEIYKALYPDQATGN